ncbi:MAG: bis-aminopropyl spermidine synthase family protein [Candidatus Heimdallarchaeaceae archaeon]
MSNLPISDDIITKFNQAFDIIDKIRGKPNSELDQYFVTRETSLKRALLVNPEDYNQKRIIVLGDMDLVSLGIGILSKPKDLAVIDLDKRVPEIALNMKFDQKIRSVRFINQDIRIRMIAILKNQFDYIFIEPPMTKEGLEVGLSRAVQCAKKNEPSKIFLSFDAKDKQQLIDEYVEKMNLTIESVKKSFNEYEFDTPLGTRTSNLYVLDVNENSKETIQNHYFGPMYYRESTQVPKLYECKCSKTHSVGQGGEYGSLEELMEKGCPECGYAENFRYASSIMLE